MPDERRRRAFAVAARNGDDAPAQVAEGQFDFANDGHTGFPRRLKRRQRRRDTRAEHNFIGGTQGFRAMCSGFNGNAFRWELDDFRRQLFSRALVGEGHLRAARRQKPRRADATDASADHDEVTAGIALVVRVVEGRHRYRSLSVARATRAKKICTMRKRKTILDSFQPVSSKWWCSGDILKIRLPMPVCGSFVSL